jgi:hypothetical protein
MAEIPLIQAAKITGIAYATLKKQSQRGQLRIKMIDGRTYVEEEDLEAYMATREFADIHDRIVGQPLSKVADEAGSMVKRLPQTVRRAIHGGVVADGRHDEPDRISLDPHHGFPVGYKHKEDPKWWHVGEQTWELGGASWTFSPSPVTLGAGTWIGGGKNSGQELSKEFSPANPLSIYRPRGYGS